MVRMRWVRYELWKHEHGGDADNDDSAADRANGNRDKQAGVDQANGVDGADGEEDQGGNDIEVTAAAAADGNAENRAKQHVDGEDSGARRASGPRLPG